MNTDIIDKMLAAVDETRFLRIGSGESAGIADFLREVGVGKKIAIVADENTWDALGRAVFHRLKSADVAMSPPVILNAPGLHAEMRHVDHIQRSVAGAFPLAVGSGTINDMTKLAAERLGTRYVCVGTAASMDGYNASGASIVENGVKQTFACKAPIGVLIDLDVLAAAPPWLNAAGYADLAAKIPAGADWILADALGVDPIDDIAWNWVQGGLRDCLMDAGKIASGDRGALGRLVFGLLASGFAMQKVKHSRPASGAEHQFSHLWDMRGHTFKDEPVSHGFKVGIGTLCSTRMYERLFKFDKFDVEAAAARYSSFDLEPLLDELSEWPTLTDLAKREWGAKLVDDSEFKERFRKLNGIWPDLMRRLAEQLIPSDELTELFKKIGAPTRSEEIGVSADLLDRSHWHAMLIRRRFTVLDLAFPLAVPPFALC